MAKPCNQLYRDETKEDAYMSVRVVYEDVAVGAADAATVASSDANAFSIIQDLPHGTEQLLIETNELNQWILDGSRKIRTAASDRNVM